jgi:hypothetical protein
VEKELARERAQWEQRQEMHRGEAEALRLQLLRLHEHQEMVLGALLPTPLACTSHAPASSCMMHLRACVHVEKVLEW